MDQRKCGSIDLSDATWRKSTYSTGTGGNCVEIAVNLPYIVAIRDSKNPCGSALCVTPSAWKDFITRVAEGDFNA
jgi:Domain of unknown function (DUF397).